MVIIMFSETHYVPILKWKQGEQKAVEELNQNIKQCLTPLFEIPPIDWDYENDQPKKSIDQHLQNIGEALQKTWGLKRPIYIDTYWLEPHDHMENGEHPLEFIVNNASQFGINVIPVTSPNRDPEYQQIVKKINNSCNQGIGIRIDENDYENLNDSINELINTLEVTVDQVDLFIDNKYFPPEEEATIYYKSFGLINNLPHVLKWRNLILSGTSFPKNLTGIEANSVEVIPRSEWKVWKKMLQHKETLARIPTFSDYCIAHTEPFEGDPRLTMMSANIRYTAQDKFIIFKGMITRKYGFSQYHDLANQVINHEEYYGPTFSAGDKFINDVAKRNDRPGSATSWRRAGTNHHLTVVVTELSNYPLI